jgi:para-nitrobenzyl esterase
MKKLLLAVLVLGAVTYIALRPDDKPATVERVAAPASARDISGGPVVGSEDEMQTFAWLGLPFAAPPVGELRWAAPRPAQDWQQPLQATQFNNACVQLWGPLAGVEGEPGQVVGNEDCLYLNVFAPQESDGPLPVMFWMHGGGNTIGTANTYPAGRLAGEQNVVVVTINYRLGLFGWLSHEALREGRNAVDGSGNYGTLDMIAALQWVQENVATFGGDPDNVTIFGESAGGRNVYTLMASPLAKGLFHKAISQSGLTSTTPLWRAENFVDDANPGLKLSSAEWLVAQLQHDQQATDREAAKQLLQQMSVGQTRDFLYSRSPEQILQGLEGAAGMYRAPQVFRDGAVLPVASLLSRLSDTRQYHSVPLLTGTNRDELKLFLAQSPEYVERRFGFLPRVKDLAAFNRAVAYGSDSWKANAVDEVATVISANGGKPVYAYRWDWDEGGKSLLVDYAQLLGAAHGLEVAYVFDDFDGGILVPGLYNKANIPGRDTLAAQMRSYWAEFAYTGSPGRGRAGDLPNWSSWSSGADKLMLLDSAEGGGLRMVNQPMTVAMVKQRLAEDPHMPDQQARCAAWASMFLQANHGDDFWDAAEYEALGCADHNPWLEL